MLDLVDRQLRHFEPGEMATAVVAYVEPSFERLHLSVAGHPAPVVAAAGGGGRYLDVPVDTPLGVASPLRRQVTTVDLPPGSVVCFYTDGLVERRRAASATAEPAGGGRRRRPPEEVCTTVMNRLIGRQRPSDDVALLVVRRQEDTWRRST